MTKLKVALFAGQDLGYMMADYFSKRDDIDLFVVSFQSQRDKIYGYRDAARLCKDGGIPHIETTKPYEGTRETFERWRPDIIVAAYYARLFPPELLRIPYLGAINAHPGKFPKYQGPMPTPWYILNGETTFGMGIFQIDEGIDTGPVFMQREYAIPDDVTGHELLRLTQKAAADLYVECFDRIVSGELVAVPQRGEALFCPRIEPQFRIDWKASREMILRRVRIHAKPYFPAYTFAYNHLIGINRARACDADCQGDGVPGQILEVFDDRKFVVACTDGALLVTEFDSCPPLTQDEWRLHIRVGGRLA